MFRIARAKRLPMATLVVVLSAVSCAPPVIQEEDLAVVGQQVVSVGDLERHIGFWDEEGEFVSIAQQSSADRDAARIFIHGELRKLVLDAAVIEEMRDSGHRIDSAVVSREIQDLKRELGADAFDQIGLQASEIYRKVEDALLLDDGLEALANDNRPDEDEIAGFIGEGEQGLEPWIVHSHDPEAALLFWAGPATQAVTVGETIRVELGASDWFPPPGTYEVVERAPLASAELRNAALDWLLHNRIERQRLALLEEHLLETSEDVLVRPGDGLFRVAEPLVDRLVG
jgi:hypothetical protein